MDFLDALESYLPPETTLTGPQKPPAKSVKKTGPKAGAVVPQKHGGAIYQGAPKNPVAGTGRPPEVIRAAMRELGATKGLPFLSGVLDGKIDVQFVGTCPRCKAIQPLPEGEALDTLVDAVSGAVRASVDHRLKANEQAFKYGLGEKVQVNFTEHPEFQRRMAALRQALIEIVGEDQAIAVVTRAEELSQ